MRIDEVAAGLATPALFLVPGVGIARLLPELWRLGLLRRLAFSYLLGIAWLGGSFYLLSYLFEIGLGRGTIAALIAIPVGAGWVVHARARKMPSARRPRPRRLPRLSVVAGVVIGLLYLALLVGAVTYPLRDFDGRMTWSANARFVRAEASVLPRVLREPQWFVSHPGYPLLLPIAQAMSLEVFAGAEDAFFFRTLYATIYPALLLVLYEGARRRAGEGAATLAVLTAALLPYLSFVLDGGAAGAYSDLPLAAFFGAALVLLLRRAGAASGAAAGLLLAAMVLSKREGTILALGAIGAAVLSARWPLSGRAGARREVLRLGIASAITLGAVAFYSSWRSAVPSGRDENYLALLRETSPVVLLGAALQLGARGVPTIAREMLDPAQWSLFWWIAPLILAVGARGWMRRRSLPLLLAAILPPAVALAAYLMRPQDLSFIDVTWNRFLVQAAVPVFLIWAEALRRAVLRR